MQYQYLRLTSHTFSTLSRLQCLKPQIALCMPFIAILISPPLKLLEQ